MDHYTGRPPGSRIQTDAQRGLADVLAVRAEFLCAEAGRDGAYLGIRDAIALASAQFGLAVWIVTRPPFGAER
ncbi:hypothetical protein ACFT0G_31285 [Streptomyces sp. NPDC057020]|uniref:hypothetical protein n=1 Tax=unclassified Streptomyces TaxID=2593676 RepID=UPI0036369A82